MGAYLSEPKLDKDSADGGTARLSYGVSAMQGWRISMEDAHNCIPDFDENTSLFAVYDGHGGAEVAEYCAKYLPDHLQSLQLYQEGNLRDALQEGFLSFDERLTREEVVNELKQLAGLSEDEEQNEQETTDDPEDEASLLKREADMSIEEILARYGKAQNKATAALRKKNKLQSPVVRKTQSRLGENCTENGEVEADANCSKVEKSASKPEVSEASSTSFTKAEPSAPRDSSENEAKPKTANGEGDGLSSSHDSTREESAVGSSSSCAGSASEMGAGDAACSNSEPSSSSSLARGQGSSSEGEGSTVTGQGSSGESSSGQGSAEDNGCSSVSSSTGGKGKGKGKKSGPSDVAGGSSSVDAPRGSRAPPDSSEEEEEEEEEDSDDEMFEEDDSEEDSDDLEDDDEDDEDGEEEEEDGEEDDGPIIFSDKEQPGSDSGTTAVVALLSEQKLYVGNAGDSRCVLCRAGRAIDMSIDHKPEDEEERDRITKAGGKVTQDGRVNGGLNLSRAIGDHCYKRNEDLPLKDQMITSLPDVRTIDLEPDDEFMVLACDGIWNVLTSQQVVDFVRNRLAEETPDGGKRTLSSICEELFDLCLAPDTTGDGTGCDNMTCIVVKLHNSQSAAKRPLEDGQTEASQAKKPRPDEPDTSSG